MKCTHWACSGNGKNLRGKPDIAISFYGRAVESARTVGNPAYEARYLYALGAVYQAQWEFVAARSHFKEAKAIYQALDDGRNATRVRATIVYSYLLAVASRIMNLLGLRPKRD